MEETNIQIVGDSIFDLWLKKGIVSWDILKLQQELLQTPIRIAIQEKKKELKEIEDLEEKRKEFVKNHLMTHGIKSIEFTSQKVTVKQNPWSVNIVDEELLDKKYYKEKTTVSIDKKKIKDELKQWFAIPWAEMQHSHTLLITPK